MGDLSGLESFLLAAIRMTTPIALGAVGAAISERSGIINIGIEGQMILGGFVAGVACYFLGPWVGLMAGILIGVLLGALLAFFCVYVGGNQIVFGIGMNILGLGGSTLGLFLLWGNRGTSEWLTGLPDIRIPAIENIPFLGKVFSGHDPIVYLSWAIVVLSYFIMFRTNIGLRLRAAGEDPAAVETAGLNVFRIRFIAVTVSGILSSLAGVSLSLGITNVVSHNMTAGRGFLAFAANMVGAYHPLAAYGASFLFGAMDALRMRLVVTDIPPQFLQMIPYVTTLLVLLAAGRFTRKPAAVGAEYPYRIKKGKRRMVKPPASNELASEMGSTESDGSSSFN